MNRFLELLLQTVMVLLILLAAFFAYEAIAQECMTYYDQNTGRYCRVCPGPGGVGTVVCY